MVIAGARIKSGHDDARPEKSGPRGIDDVTMDSRVSADAPPENDDISRHCRTLIRQSIILLRPRMKTFFVIAGTRITSGHDVA